MYWSVSKLQTSGTVFMIIISWVTAFDEAEDDKTLNLKVGFDLTRGKNGAPSLRIRSFEEVPELGGKKIKGGKEGKGSLRAGSSSESDDDKKGEDKISAHKDKEPNDSNGSDDGDTSGSDGDRRLSTKGILPNEFEPERNPSVHERNKGSDSE